MSSYTAQSLATYKGDDDFGYSTLATREYDDKEGCFTCFISLSFGTKNGVMLWVVKQL